MSSAPKKTPGPWNWGLSSAPKKAPGVELGIVLAPWVVLGEHPPSSGVDAFDWREPGLAQGLNSGPRGEVMNSKSGPGITRPDPPAASKENQPVRAVIIGRLESGER